MKLKNTSHSTKKSNLHVASKETYHFFRATVTKIHPIKIYHIWTLISYYTPYEAHDLWQIKGLLLSKRRKINNKITETAHWEPPRKTAYLEHSIAIHSISMSMAGLTAVLAFVRVELRAQEARCEQFLWFLKSEFLWLHCSFLLFDLSESLFLEMCLV